MRKPIKSPAIATSSLIGPLMLVSKSMRTLMTEKLEELGLWPGQDEILLALEHGGQSVGTVADRANVRPSTVSKSVSILIAMGLVTRTKHFRDNRSSTVTLTSSGEEMVQRIRELYADVNSDFTKQIKHTQVAMISQHLEQVHTQLMKRLSKHR